MSFREQVESLFGQPCQESAVTFRFAVGPPKSVAIYRDDCWVSRMADGTDRGSCRDGDLDIVDTFGEMWSEDETLVEACPAHVELYKTERPYSPKKPPGPPNGEAL